MALRYDEALDENGDTLIDDTGDIDFAPSDEDHIIDTINAAPGWWKEYPADGVDIMQYSAASSTSLSLLARKIKVELNSDGYQVANPIIGLDPAGNLSINPNATIV